MSKEQLLLNICEYRSILWALFVIAVIFFGIWKKFLKSAEEDEEE